MLNMRKTAQTFLTAVLLILVLPYMITNFFSGKERDSYVVQTATEDFISIRQGEAIQEVSFEDYVMGVAATQIDGNTQPEALKAQMVLARTELKKQLEDNPGELLSEPYITLEELEERGTAQAMMQAAEATMGQVLTYEGGLIHAPFHAVSSGTTRSGEEAFGKGKYEWLSSVASHQDVEAERYLDVQFLRPSQVRNAISQAGPDILAEGDLADQIEVIKRDSGDYVEQVRVGNTQMSGEKFRSLLNLNSSCFYIEEDQKGIRITTKGLGHGLGMSQYGAESLAESGKTYVQILQYYFPKCIIV
jgi:stage II sporulation protein D